EEHKKKDCNGSGNFTKFSKCSEKWKTCLLKKRAIFEDLSKVDEVYFERKMKIYIPRKGESKKKFTIAPKRLPLAFLFCSEYHPKSEESFLAFPLVMLQRNWEQCGTAVQQTVCSPTQRRLLS
ncbi:Putative high mobility group protein B1-like 1, partial [Lemmus lemmus]